MRFTINLATRSYLDHRLVNQIVIVCMVMLLALLAWNISRLSWNMGELRRLKTDISSFENRLNSRPAGVSEKDFNRMQSSISFYNGVIEHKTFNWLGLLDKLETVTPEGISLAAFDPETKNGGMQIEGRCASFAQVRSYLEKLEDSRLFSNIQLVSHQNLSLGEKTRGVQFVITCRVVKP